MLEVGARVWLALTRLQLVRHADGTRALLQQKKLVTKAETAPLTERQSDTGN